MHPFLLALVTLFLTRFLISWKILNFILKIIWIIETLIESPCFKSIHFSYFTFFDYSIWNFRFLIYQATLSLFAPFYLIDRIVNQISISDFLQNQFVPNAYANAMIRTKKSDLIIFFSLSFHSNGQVIFSVNVHARFVVVVVTFRFELNFHTLDFCISGNIRIERRRKNNCRPTAGEWKKMKWKKEPNDMQREQKGQPSTITTIWKLCIFCMYAPAICACAVHFFFGIVCGYMRHIAQIPMVLLPIHFPRARILWQKNR